MFRLVKRHVTSPSGVEFQRTFVSTPGAVGIVAVTDDHRVVLVTQYRAAVHASVREIPAGMRDVPGEDPMETARRELREETGYIASAFQRLGICLSSPGVTDSAVEVYLATGLTSGDSEPHGPEEDSMVIEHHKFSDALEMIDRGEISDAKTVYGLLLAARQHPNLLG
jgi:ADP-ribose pyrophosphatase